VCILDVGHPAWREDGYVIYLYNCLWALPEQSLSGRSPAELTIIFYCLIWDSPNLEGQVPVFISPRNRVVQLYPCELGSVCVVSYDSQGYGRGILTCLHTGLILDVKKSKSWYSWRSVSQYVVVSSSLWDLWPDIILCLKVAVLSLLGALSDERSGLSIHRPVFYLKFNSTLWVCPYLTGNTLRLRYEPNRLMLSIGLWEMYITITITILDIVHRPVFYLKQDVSETGFCLRIQVETETSSFYWANLSRFHLKTETESSLRNVVL
jgi:hypothetical protein